MCQGPLRWSSRSMRAGQSRVQSRVPGEDLELVSRAPAVLVSAKGFPVSAVRRLLEELRRRLVGRVQVGDQDGTLAILTGQPAVPAVDPTFVVLAQAREGVVHAQPQRAFDGAAAGEGAADVRCWRGLDPQWQADWRCRRSSAVQKRRWRAARDARCGHALTVGGRGTVAILLVGRRPPTLAATARTSFSRRCLSGGRCTVGTGSRNRRGRKARNNPWRWRGAGPPRPWLGFLFPGSVDHLVTPERVGHVCRHPNVVVRHVVVRHRSQHAQPTTPNRERKEGNEQSQRKKQLKETKNCASKE